MTDDQIKFEFENLKVQIIKNEAYSATYKPLLVLYMLGQYWHCNKRLMLFREVADPVRRLLDKFVKKSKYKDSPWYPFWHLRTEKAIWELHGIDDLHKQIGSKRRPYYTEAINSDLRGGFTVVLYRRILHDKVFMLEIIFVVLKKYFPKNLHIDLLESVGIPEQHTITETNTQFIP